MSKQEQEILEEEVNTEISEEETAETAEAAQEEAALDAEKLAAELADLNQRFLRVAADFDNYKRRTVQEKEDLVKYSNAKIMGELLPVLDAFQLALKNPGESQEAQNVIKGVEMLYRQIMQVLEQAGMSKIEAVGQPFDPKLHEAIMQVDDDSVPEDTVVEELRAGYVLNERVIRPSMVKVSR
ncbi:MAG: nucleotide exchange factor GrpE [Peptococcaceae bacterium]